MSICSLTGVRSEFLLDLVKCHQNRVHRTAGHGEQVVGRHRILRAGNLNVGDRQDCRLSVEVLVKLRTVVPLLLTRPPMLKYRSVVDSPLGSIFAVLVVEASDVIVTLTAVVVALFMPI